MNDDHIDKLEKALELIQSVLDHDAANTAILAIWLSVAGDYCKEIAEEINV